MEVCSGYSPPTAVRNLYELTFGYMGVHIFFAITFIILHNFTVIPLKGKREVSAAAEREACNKSFADPVFFVGPIRSWSVSRTWVERWHRCSNLGIT